jgi:hypothetical protein
MLEVSIEVLFNIDSIIRPFLCTASEKVTDKKCKVIRNHVYKPNDYGGLGIPCLTKFTYA